MQGSASDTDDDNETAMSAAADVACAQENADAAQRRVNRVEAALAEAFSNYTRLTETLWMVYSYSSTHFFRVLAMLWSLAAVRNSGT